MPRTTPHRERETGAALISVLVVTIALLAFAFATLSYEIDNSQDCSTTTESVQAEMVAHAALNIAFHEITTNSDPTGYGIGAMGLDAPETLLSVEGDTLGEYRTYVENNGDGTATIRALAATPDFLQPRAVRSVEARVTAYPSFDLISRPGAMVISGPLSSLDLKWLGNNSVRIDGGKAAAVSATKQNSFDLTLAEVGTMLGDGTLENSMFGGSVTTEYETSSGMIDVPVVYTERDYLSADQIDTYREGMRNGALAMAATADRVYSSEITGDQQWGTPDAPETVYIDATRLVDHDIFSTSGQTISGSGTLIIEGSLRPNENLNLDWDGDIIVIGDSSGGGNLVDFHGTEAHIRGNLVLLSDANGEGSVLIDDSDGSTTSRPSNVHVEGALLGMSDATRRTFALDIDKNSSLTVDGLLGLYASEIDTRTQTQESSLSVNGSMAVGMPDEVRNGSLHNPFSFNMNGKVNIVYDESKVLGAVRDLGVMEEIFDIGGDDGLTADGFTLLGTVADRVSGDQAITEFETVRSSLGSVTDLGFDLDAVLAVIVGN